MLQGLSQTAREAKSWPFEQARLLLDRITRLRLTDAERDLAAALFAQGKFDEAVKDYEAATRIDPKHVEAYNGLAWLRATAADQHDRDGAAAVENGTKACELTGWKQWGTIDTLAAAYAEKGDFKQAVSWQQTAIELAPTAEDKESMQSRLALYRAGKPYHQASSGP